MWFIGLCLKGVINRWTPTELADIWGIWVELEGLTGLGFNLVGKCIVVVLYNSNTRMFVDSSKGF